MKRLPPKKRFKCSYCDQRYVRESAFLAHRCKRMIREEEARTIEGKMAWHCYCLWLQKAKRFTPTFDTFMESAQYTQFMKFAIFARAVQVADVQAYISIMISENSIPPLMWTTPDAHSLYLCKLDRVVSPMHMVGISVDTLLELSETYNVGVSGIFDVVSPNEIIRLIQRRKLSQWLVLKSPKFIRFYMGNTSNEERVILDTLINVDFWYGKFSKHPDEIKLIKDIVIELNI